MLKQCEGSHAVAEAVALCRPEVICAYPISPQTHIVEGLGEFVKDMRPDHLLCLPATELSLKHVGRAVPNVPLLGGFAAASGLISLASVIAAIKDKFGGKVAEGNIAAATEAYNRVKNIQNAQTREASHA